MAMRVCLCIVLIAGSGLAQNKLCVPSPQYPSIGSALAVAVPGDIVAVAPGTYSGPVFLREGVQLSGAGAQVTSIVAPGAGAQNCVTVMPAVQTFPDKAIIDGFTFSGLASVLGSR